MLTKQQRQLVTYKKITIYEQTYELLALKNTKLQSIQKKVKERRRLIKEGVRYYHFWRIFKRKEEISRQEIFQESKLLIKDYTSLIDFLEKYEVSYQNFLLKLANDLNKLFVQKSLEIKKLDNERKKLEIKNYNNQKIIQKLKWEKEENFKATLLLSNACFLMLEKIKLLSEGLKTLVENTKKQKQIVQKVVQDLEIYQEIYAYQRKAQKIRQEIVEIAEISINLENSLQECFSPFQLLIDEVVKIDEDFYATVEDIQTLVDSILNSQLNVLIPKEKTDISDIFLDFMVSSYEKKERLRDALIQCQLLDWQTDNFELANNLSSIDKEISSVSDYIFEQLAEQRKNITIAETDFISRTSLPTVQETAILPKDPVLTKEVKYKIDYTKLRILLAQHKWKEADAETTTLMLKVMGRSDWNEVYKEDIDNFSCQELQTIDQLWKEYSQGHFGFSVQQGIWSGMGGQVDYETEKLVGDRLGWREQGNWLDYDQLTFELSPATPIGHLPVQWLHYHSKDLSSKSSAGQLSVGGWRVKSWLVWQMHLFWSRAKVCEQTYLGVEANLLNNRDSCS